MKRAQKQGGASRRGFLCGAIATALGVFVGTRGRRRRPAPTPARPLTSTEDPARTASLPLWIGHL